MEYDNKAAAMDAARGDGSLGLSAEELELMQADREVNGLPEPERLELEQAQMESGAPAPGQSGPGAIDEMSGDTYLSQEEAMAAAQMGDMNLPKSEQDLEDERYANAYRAELAEDHAIAQDLQAAHQQNQDIDMQAQQTGLGTPPGLAEAMLSMVQQDHMRDNQEDPDSYGDPRVNTIPKQSKMPGMQALPNEVGRVALEIAAQEFPSLSPMGIMMDPNDRMRFVMAVMENEKIPSTHKAQVLDQSMRDGTLVLEALPDIWYQARGLPLKR